MQGIVKIIFCLDLYSGWIAEVLFAKYSASLYLLIFMQCYKAGIQAAVWTVSLTKSQMPASLSPISSEQTVPAWQLKRNGSR